MEENVEEEMIEKANGYLEAIYIELDKMKFYLLDELPYKINNPDMEFCIHVSIFLGIIGVISSIISWKVWRKVQEKIPENIKKKVIAAKEFVVPPSGPRFRKRDKMAFVGAKTRTSPRSNHRAPAPGVKRRPSPRTAPQLPPESTNAIKQQQSGRIN